MRIVKIKDKYYTTKVKDAEYVLSQYDDLNDPTMKKDIAAARRMGLKAKPYKFDKSSNAYELVITGDYAKLVKYVEEYLDLDTKDIIIDSKSKDSKVKDKSGVIESAVWDLSLAVRQIVDKNYDLAKNTINKVIAQLIPHQREL